MTGTGRELMIRFDGVTKRYPRTGAALDDVSFHLRKGEFAFLTGPSGAGKSTLLDLAHMQTLPTEGVVRVSRFSSETIRRKEVPELRRRVGFVFQDFRLLDRLTAAENVAFALEATGTPRREVDEKVQKLMSQVGLAAKAKSYPQELSGGERQRVAIARALATDPLVLLADEPTGNLDERAARGVFQLFRRINDLGMAVLLATHDVALLRAHPEVRALELEHGELVYDSGADGTGGEGG
jgi:cell division transport system ATP-binding protein